MKLGKLIGQLAKLDPDLEVYITDIDGTFIPVKKVINITDIHQLPPFNKRQHLPYSKIDYIVLK